MKIEDLKYTIPTAPINEDDFDIETWRRENPMDYLKALYLILSSNDLVTELPTDIAMSTTFNAIYKVTRLYIPNTLYKFCTLTNDQELNVKKFSTLQNKQIFMSDIKDFNDPFDGKAFYYNPDKLKDIKGLTQHNGKLIDDFTSFIKATSLTENDPNIMPMWAHYSNNHQGFCVAYDMKNPSNNALSSCTFPVQYTNQRLDITSFMKEYATSISAEIDNQISSGNKQINITNLSLIYVAQYLFNIKHSTWQYEKEFRCTVGAIAKGMPYIDAIPKAIYIGMNCCKTDQQQLLSIASNLSIPAYQMKFNELSADYTLGAEPLN